MSNTISLSLGEETIRRLQLLAKAEERSDSAQARVMLDKALNEAGIPRKKDGNKLGLKSRKALAGIVPPPSSARPKRPSRPADQFMPNDLGNYRFKKKQTL